MIDAVFRKSKRRIGALKILITGATGFIGSAVMHEALARGHDVRILARRTSPLAALDGARVEIALGDLRDGDSLTRALAGCEALFHVAAEYRMWAPDPAVIYDSNVTGTRNIMRAALRAGIGRIVYTSTVAAIAMTGSTTPADEETPGTLEDMTGHYKRSKYLAERDVRRMIADDGLPCVIVNPSVPAGPRDVKPTPTGRMILETAKGRIPAWSSGGLNLVHVDDVAAGHWLAFEKGAVGERYILAGENMRIRTALMRVAEIAGARPPRFRMPAALALPAAHAAQAWARLIRSREPLVTVEGVKLSETLMYYSHDKAARDLGFRPRPADEGIRDEVAWFRRMGYL